MHVDLSKSIIDTDLHGHLVVLAHQFRQKVLPDMLIMTAKTTSEGVLADCEDGTHTAIRRIVN